MKLAVKFPLQHFPDDVDLPGAIGRSFFCVKEAWSRGMRSNAMRPQQHPSGSVTGWECYVGWAWGQQDKLPHALIPRCLGPACKDPSPTERGTESG